MSSARSQDALLPAQGIAPSLPKVGRPRLVVQFVFHLAYPRLLLVVYILLFERSIMAWRAQTNIVEIRRARRFAAPPARLPPGACSLQQPQPDARFLRLRPLCPKAGLLTGGNPDVMVSKGDLGIRA